MLSPALSERARPGLPRRGRSRPAITGGVAAPGTALPEVVAATPNSETPPAAAGSPIPVVSAPVRSEKVPKSGKPSGPQHGLARGDQALAGGRDVVASRQGAPPIGPVLATPSTTVVDLPEAAVAPPTGPRRFRLHVLGVDQERDEVRVRVRIDGGSDQLTSTVTVGLRPSGGGATDDRAVRVSIDAVDTEGESPKLRVRVTVVEDTTGGTASATESAGTETSNVIDVAVPVTPPGEDEAASEAAPIGPTGSEIAMTGDLLLQLGPPTSSTVSASAPGPPDEDGSGTQPVTVEVSVTTDPPEASEPVTQPAAAAAPADGTGPAAQPLSP